MSRSLYVEYPMIFDGNCINITHKNSNFGNLKKNLCRWISRKISGFESGALEIVDVP